MVCQADLRESLVAADMAFPEADPDIGFGDRQFTWRGQAIHKDVDVGHKGRSTDGACVTVGPAGTSEWPMSYTSELPHGWWWGWRVCSN